MNANLVADWWWTTWFDILSTFSQLLNLNPRCKIRATNICLQRTIALYLYKLFNLFPFSVVLWGKYVQTLDNMCDRNPGFVFFLATYATSFRMMTLYFTMWVNKYSAKDSVYLFFARSQRSALFITHGQIYSKGNQAQCDCSFSLIFFS